MAFHGGMLAALEEATGWDPRQAEVVVGTSAGALSAALLRRGLAAADLRAVTEETPLTADGAALVSMGRPHRPRPRPSAFIGLRPPGDSRAAVRSLLHPWRLHPRTLWSTLLPEGPVPTDSISASLDEADGGVWPVGRLWVCAVRLSDGRRVVFGRSGAPTATLGQAVAASCAIPGFFQPVRIGSERYVDGGVASVHNLGLLDDENLDAIVVSAPMSYAGPRPHSADWAMRQIVRTQLDREIRRLQRRGVPVITVAPDRRVILAMGVDVMDARHRGAVSREARRATLARLERTGLGDLLGAGPPPPSPSSQVTAA
jgi:NTE family protein